VVGKLVVSVVVGGGMVGGEGEGEDVVLVLVAGAEDGDEEDDEEAECLPFLMIWFQQQPGLV